MINIIKKIPLFSKIENTKLEDCIAKKQIRIKQYTKNMTVYNQTDSCKTLDIVLSGSLVAYSLSENGSAMAMFEFKKNSLIGANLLFGNANAYPLNIYCLGDAKLLHIEREAVEFFLHDYDFTLTFVRSISQNSQGLNRKIVMLTQNTLRENILNYLKQQAILQNSNIITLPISKKQLADYFGVRRPSLFRELKKMKDENLIEIENHTIVIK